MQMKISSVFKEIIYIPNNDCALSCVYTYLHINVYILLVNKWLYLHIKY